MRGLHGLLEIKTFLLVYAVGIELDLIFLLEELVHVGFGGEQFFLRGGVGGHAVGQVGLCFATASLLGSSQMCQWCFLTPVCVDQLICPVTGHAAHTQVFQPQVVPHSTKEAGDLPGW